MKISMDFCCFSCYNKNVAIKICNRKRVTKNNIDEHRWTKISVTKHFVGL